MTETTPFDPADLSIVLLHAADLARLPDAVDSRGVEDAFAAIAGLLASPPGPERHDSVALAARELTGARAAWLLAPSGGHWVTLGRSLGPELADARIVPPGQVKLVPLVADDLLVGLLAYWVPDGCAGSVEGAFEQALTAALQVRHALDESRWLTNCDPLTELPNRRAMDEAFPRMVALARRSGRPLAVLMLDLDRFKAVNDTWGHEVGDQVLKACARAIASSLRASDLAVRYGGEEFLVVLPETGPPDARAVAEKVRAAIAAQAVPLPGGGTLHQTVSVGVASLREGDDLDSLVARADAALYRAKAAGRDRVCGEG